MRMRLDSVLLEVEEDRLDVNNSDDDTLWIVLTINITIQLYQ